MKKIFKLAYARSIGWMHIDFNHDYKKSIFLVGTGRSGTTWIMDLINYRNEYRGMFEPFNPKKVGIYKDYSYRQYLPPSYQNEKLYKMMKKILSGQIRNFWIDRYNKKVFCKKRIIKSIRANLMLKWIHNNFPEMPIVFIIRHPCAVAYSKMKLKWDTHIDSFLQQPNLVKDYLQPYLKEIKNAQTDFEKHIFMWCIENFIPLQQFKKNEIHLVFYEKLCDKPEEEVAKLFAYLKKDYDKSIFDRIDEPSLLSRSDSKVVLKQKKIGGWKEHITSAQEKQYLNILKLFKLDNIYNEKIMPLFGMSLLFFNFIEFC